MVPQALTRSSVKRDHALIAPDSHVPAALPGWTKTKGIILISPVMGARFTQYYAMMERGAESGDSIEPDRGHRTIVPRAGGRAATAPNFGLRVGDWRLRRSWRRAARRVEYGGR